MVATAHGVSLANLVKNPDLNPLVGGICQVTISDGAAAVKGYACVHCESFWCSHSDASCLPHSCALLPACSPGGTLTPSMLMCACRYNSHKSRSDSCLLRTSLLIEVMYAQSLSSFLLPSQSLRLMHPLCRSKKTISMRRGAPVFQCLVEILSYDTLRLHLNVAASVDAILEGRHPSTQLRRSQNESFIVRFEVPETSEQPTTTSWLTSLAACAERHARA